MTASGLFTLRISLAALLVVGLGSTGLAQSYGTVTADRAIIWRSDTSVVAAVVDAGAVLEVIGRSDRWYEVVIPLDLGGRGERGLIAITQVTLLEGATPPPERSLRGRALPPQSGQKTPPAARSAPAPGPRVAVRGFGQAGLIGFAARRSFTALAGNAYGSTLGAGAQVRFRGGLYVQASVERFEETGQRVFVFGGETFPLGIPNTVTVQPVLLAVGYRPPSAVSLRPYLGVGIGSYLLTEVSRFDDPSEQVERRHAGYHIHGGVEFWAHRWFAPAVEARYTTVPDALAGGGTAAEFGERDLGGWQVHAKIFVGP